MHPDSVGKTAFCTHMGNYEFLRMSFGLKNSGSCFQRTLNKTLSGLVGKICFIYIDDIVIFSKNSREHAENLNIVFQRLRELEWKVKSKKCYFGKKEVELLGYRVSAKGIVPQE